MATKNRGAKGKRDWNAKSKEPVRNKNQWQYGKLQQGVKKYTSDKLSWNTKSK